MRALVLFSHGSLLCGSGALLESHAAALRATGLYAAVEPGYLNYSAPSIEVAVQKCTAAAAGQIVIVPYFLITGKFVSVDLPARLRKIARQFPAVQLSVAEPLGFSGDMAAAAEDVLDRAVPPGHWQAHAVTLAQRACELRKDCPVYGSSLCKAGTQL